MSPDLTSTRISLDELVKIDRFADRYEQEWQKGAPPDLRSWISESKESLSLGMWQTLAMELVKVDYSWRTRLGENVCTNDYHDLFLQIRPGEGILQDEFLRDLDRIRPDQPSPLFVGRFRLLGKIGHGAFADVYLARDVELERDVAVKIQHEGSVRQEQGQARVFREARAAANLNHPGIVKILEIVQHRGDPVIVSEFLPGKSLRQLLDGTPLWTFDDVARLIRDVAEALHYAHRHGIIHRDIKPSNLLITTDGRPVILDFGLAKNDSDAGLTCSGQILGTPAYMSPEQASGNKELIDGRADVYSLGTVLYEMLSGAPPFRGSPHRLLHQVVHDEPPSPSHLRGGIPPDLERICLKALEKSPDRRYASASAFADDLSRFLQREPVSARSPGPASRIRRWCRRNPAVAIWGSVVLLILTVATIAGTVIGMVQAKHAGESDRARRAAQTTASRNLAATGVGKLRAGDGLGLLDLLQSCRAVPDNPRELGSRALLLESWLDSLDGQLVRSIHCHDPNSVWFSPDGTRMAICGRTGHVSIFEPDSGELLYPPLIPSDNALAVEVQFSRDNTGLIVRTNDANASYMDLTRNPPVGQRFAEYGKCRDLRFNADGKLIGLFQLAPRGSESGRIELWNLDTREPLSGVDCSMPMGGRMLLGEDLNHVGLAIPPDDSGVATAVGMIDMAGQQRTQSDPHPTLGTPDQIALAGSDCHLVVSWTNGRVKVYDKALREIAGSFLEEDVKQFEVSPDQSILATASFDSTVRLRHLDQPDRPEQILKHDGPVLCVAFCPRSEYLATGGFDSRVRVWSVRTGELVQTFRHQYVVQGVRFHPGGDRLASVASDGTARIWSVSTRSDEVHCWTHPWRVWSVDFSPDGKELLTTSQDGSAHFWSVADGAAARAQLFMGSDLVAARFNPVRQEEVVMTNLSAIEFRHVNQDTSPHDTSQFSTTFRQARYSKDGRHVVVGTDIGRCWIFRVSERELGVKILDTTPLSDIAIHPECGYFATGCKDGKVRLWTLPDGSSMRRTLIHPAGVEAVAFSADGKTLAVATRDNSIRFWDTDNWTEGEEAILTEGIVQGLQFSPDSRLLAVAAASGKVEVYEMVSKVPICRSFGHRVFATSVAFSPDGRMLATGSFDKTARLWRLPDLPRSDSGVDAGKIHLLEERVLRALGLPTGALDRSGKEF